MKDLEEMEMARRALEGAGVPKIEIVTVAHGIKALAAYRDLWWSQYEEATKLLDRLGVEQAPLVERIRKLALRGGFSEVTR